MLKLDRLKLVTSAKFITNLNQSFIKIPTHKGEYYYKYHQDVPFALTIIVFPIKNELTIEFTGKILGDNYHLLISKQTIKQCFSKICTNNICSLNIEEIIRNSKVCLCDVTKDITCPYPMSEIKTHIKASIKNYDKWLVRKCQNNGLEIYNSVTTKRRFKRIIIYDKYKELHRAENKIFLSSCENPDKMIEKFFSKIRIEFNLRSMEQIRKYLHVKDTSLESVLCSEAEPILEIWDEVIEENLSSVATSNPQVYNSLEKLSILKECNYDLQAVEMRLRASTRNNTSIRRKMESYKKLLQSIQSDEVRLMNIRNLIK